MKDELKNKLSDKSAVIGVVGLGYVGIPLSVSFANSGYKVLGLDIDKAKVDFIAEGKTYIKHIPDAAIQDAVSKGFEATTDFMRATEADALILCVPTPLDLHREPDLSFVLDTIDSLLPYLRKGQVVSLESTTYPGTTQEELKPRIESTGLKVGSDIFLVYSPEREDPGNENFTTRTIAKVCGGDTTSCREIGVALYDQVIDQVVAVSSTRVAEMTKLLENIHRSVNIGLVNEMKIVADKMAIDIYEVIDAAATKPFGFVPYYPGPGLGGHCIPIDPFYLTWKAREYGVNTRFIELAGEVNNAMPQWVVSKVVHGLNLHRKSINGSRILMLGIAYKKNVDDMRESPSVEIMQLMKDIGANVDYSDDYVPVFPKMRRYSFDMKSVEINESTIQSYDCIVVGTNHDNFNYSLIQENAKLIIDARGMYRGNIENVVHA
jgi:UDP-N-acetyl-D-glucosamine dehydrogenase